MDKPKWITKSKAMTNWCDRWSRNPRSLSKSLLFIRKQIFLCRCDRWSGSPVGKLMALHDGRAWQQKNSEIQVAFFNALGYESWENVWGTWNGIIERNGEALRRVGLMLRFFGARGFTYTELWTPYTAACLQMASGVYASAFPLAHETLYAHTHIYIRIPAVHLLSNSLLSILTQSLTGTSL